jgi:hypothetical protein
MSAFMVSHNHIGAIVRWYVLEYSSKTIYRDGIDPDDAAEAMTLLSAENAKSVNARYPGHEPEPADVFPADVDLKAFPELTPIEVIKACHCLRYQSSETDTYATSRAAELTRTIENAAICSLPGYKEAAWGIA